MDIREYKKHGRQGCLSLYTSNIGEVWRTDELTYFEAFIDDDSSTLSKFGAFSGDEIVGFAGLRSIDDFVWVEWVVVHKTQQGKGVGQALMDAVINKVGGVTVRLATAPNTLEFYKKCSFDVERIDKNGYPDGEDKIRMKYKHE